ncbi:hypothetical protein [Streptomyces lunalinharesii]|uniref:hypothetical protein n=1 Tax=Streptomyces lunalinharesii TaxID=333384 RepID=UPI0031DE456F
MTGPTTAPFTVAGAPRGIRPAGGVDRTAGGGPTASADNGFPVTEAEVVQRGHAPREFHCWRLLSTVIRLIRKDSHV